MKGADFERIVIGNGDGMGGNVRMQEPYVASLLADHFVAELFESANESVRRNAAGQFHAASIAISSSFTKCNWMSLGLVSASSKMEACYLPHVVAQFLPGFGLSEDGLPQRPRHVPALFRLAHLKDQFHANIITRCLVRGVDSTQIPIA